MRIEIKAGATYVTNGKMTLLTGSKMHIKDNGFNINSIPLGKYQNLRVNIENTAYTVIGALITADEGSSTIIIDGKINRLNFSVG